MEFKKCPRCGNFFHSDMDVCQACKTNENLDIQKLKNFFDYYLPVTVKLVDRYDEIENQKINSEEEKNFNTTTEKTIKEINGVFKQFLNILYQSDMNDTNVEIKVLNSMLKADGLSKNELKVEGKNDE